MRVRAFGVDWEEEIVPKQIVEEKLASYLSIDGALEKMQTLNRDGRVLLHIYGPRNRGRHGLWFSGCPEGCALDPFSELTPLLGAARGPARAAGGKLRSASRHS
jgi:hypothetical protein